MATETTAIVVFAKVPGLGIAKSRIAAESDAATAERIYEELLSTTARNMAGVPYVVAFYGDQSPARLREFFKDADAFFRQEGRNLGERMRRAAERCLAQDHRGAIIIGTDCPALSSRDLGEAADALTKGTDVVLGPATDGGYYLVGCNAKALCVFSAKSWGLPDLLEETLEIARRNRLSNHLLATHPDVDSLSDYLHWKRGPSC